jgi:hypothetical protein
MDIREWALRTLGASTTLEYETRIEELEAINAEKDSHINTLERMMEDIQRSHVNEMKGINTKLDFVVGAYKKQNLEMQALTKELLWQREEALVWRERLETKLALDAERFGESPPVTLIEIEKKRDDKKRSKKA